MFTGVPGDREAQVRELSDTISTCQRHHQRPV
jgi:hypothetical protein